jgi:hypothetical protein
MLRISRTSNSKAPVSSKMNKLLKKEWLKAEKLKAYSKLKSLETIKLEKMKKLVKSKSIGIQAKVRAHPMRVKFIKIKLRE